MFYSSLCLYTLKSYWNHLIVYKFPCGLEYFSDNQIVDRSVKDMEILKEIGEILRIIP